MHLLQVILLAAALPLAIAAAWGFRGTPVGRAMVGLPVVGAGFLLAAAGELLASPAGDVGQLWQLGSVIGVLGMAWLVVHLLHLYSGRRRVGT